MKKLVLMVTLLLAPAIKISADELLSPHSMGHILGGIGSFFRSTSWHWFINSTRTTRQYGKCQ